MKKFAVILSVMMIGTCFCLSIALADVYIIENGKDNVPNVINKGAFPMVDVPKSGEEKNTGFKFGTAHAMIGSVKIHYGTIEPNGYIGTHAGPAIYTCIITKGSGIYGNTTPDGKKTSEISFKAGDLLFERCGFFYFRLKIFVEALSCLFKFRNPSRSCGN